MADGFLLPQDIKEILDQALIEYDWAVAEKH
jgi:hypothetical protein